MYSHFEDSQSEVRKDYSEKFIEKYNYGERDKAMSYLDRSDIDIDVNYDEGSFLVQAVQEDDVELLEKLFEKGAMLGLTRALEWAAYNGHISCMELLIRHGADPDTLKGTSARTNHSRTRAFFAKQALVKTEESTANALANHFDIHRAAISSNTNHSRLPLSEQPFEPQLPSTASASTSGEIRESAHDLAVNGAHHSKSGTFTNPPLESIVYKKENLAEFSKTIIAEIHRISESSDLSQEERIRMMELGRTSVELTHFKTDNFILVRTYQEETGRLVKRFSSNPEAIAVDESYEILSTKLHYAEEKIFELAFAELNRRLSVEGSGDKDFVPKVVVVDIFDKRGVHLDICNETNFIKTSPVVICKTNEDKIYLISNSKKPVRADIVDFLQSKFVDALISKPIYQVYLDPLFIAFKIDEQQKAGTPLKLVWEELRKYEKQIISREAWLALRREKDTPIKPKYHLIEEFTTDKLFEKFNTAVISTDKGPVLPGPAEAYNEVL
jgi:hypothetical protein